MVNETYPLVYAFVDPPRQELPLKIRKDIHLMKKRNRIFGKMAWLYNRNNDTLTMFFFFFFMFFVSLPIQWHLCRSRRQILPE